MVMYDPEFSLNSEDQLTITFYGGEDKHEWSMTVIPLKTIPPVIALALAKRLTRIFGEEPK